MNYEDLDLKFFFSCTYLWKTYSKNMNKMSRGKSEREEK